MAPASRQPPAMDPQGASGAATGGAVQRYFDVRFGVTVVKVLPGGHYVTGRADEMLATILGSCVSACIRDAELGLGGMNHFMLPASADGAWGMVLAQMRYGNFAMEALINDIIARGGRRERLEIKVFGGANLGGGPASVGDRNAAFVEQFLRSQGLHIAASHLRGDCPRRIHYRPSNGVVKMLELRVEADLALLSGDARHQAGAGGAQADVGEEWFT